MFRRLQAGRGRAVLGYIHKKITRTCLYTRARLFYNFVEIGENISTTTYTYWWICDIFYELLQNNSQNRTRFCYEFSNEMNTLRKHFDDSFHEKNTVLEPATRFIIRIVEFPMSSDHWSFSKTIHTTRVPFPIEIQRLQQDYTRHILYDIRTIIQNCWCTFSASDLSARRERKKHIIIIRTYKNQQTSSLDLEFRTAMLIF